MEIFKKVCRLKLKSLRTNAKAANNLRLKMSRQGEVSSSSSLPDSYLRGSLIICPEDKIKE